MQNKALFFLAIILYYSIDIIGQGIVENPLITGQDPSVVYHNGSFYLVQSEGNIVLRKSSTIAGLKSAPKVEIWKKECCNVWAPEIQFLRGKWYVYYTKDDGDNDNHRMYVLESLDADPFGPYTHKGKIFDPSNDRWAIDGSVIEKNDSLYFVWSGWEGASNGQQNLYIAPMSNPYTISGRRVLISQPTYSWEKQGMAINEGPQPLIKNGKHFIVYSASGSWTDDYCLGMITNTDGNLLNPTSWVKTETPVFAKTSTAYGPGHHCMVEGPDGQCWNIYHANEVPGSGWGGRTIRAQNFTWDSLSNPLFGVPLPAEMVIREAMNELKNNDMQEKDSRINSETNEPAIGTAPPRYKTLPDDRGRSFSEVFEELVLP